MLTQQCILTSSYSQQAAKRETPDYSLHQLPEPKKLKNLSRISFNSLYCAIMFHIVFKLTN
jgi:hypothetical protein